MNEDEQRPFEAPKRMIARQTVTMNGEVVSDEMVEVDAPTIGHIVVERHPYVSPPTAAQALRRLREEIAGMEGYNPDTEGGMESMEQGRWLERADVLAAVDRKIKELGQ